MQKLRGSGDPGRRHRELIRARIYLPRPPLPGHYMLQKRAQGETIKCFPFGGSLWAVSLYRLIGHGLMRLPSLQRKYHPNYRYLHWRLDPHQEKRSQASLKRLTVKPISEWTFIILLPRRRTMFK